MSRQPSHDIHISNRSLPDPPIDAGEVIAFGEFLRSARERRGITLEQICRETKIPRRHLEALEHGQLAVVPGGTYRRGEIVAYAKVVGLDRNVALRRLERASETFDRPASRATSPDRVQVPSRPLVLVVLLSALAFVSYMTWNRSASDARAAQDLTGPASQPATPGRATTPIESARNGGDGSVSANSSEPPPARSSRSTVTDAPAVVAPAAAPPSDGGFVIVSDPPGARVTVDGIGWGTTPLTIRNLSAGVKQIRLTKAGYESATSAVRLVDGQTTNINIALQSKTPQP
jgi:transcriptional regulator with XRE-family HTH domain